MNVNSLLDTWAVSGTDYDEFAELIRDIDTSTEIISAETQDLTLYAVNGRSDEAVELLQYNEAQTLRREVPGQTRIRHNNLKSIGVTEEFLQEIMKSRLLVKADGKVLFTSCGLSRDLGARAQLTGNGLNNPTPERDAFLMHRYTEASCGVNIVIRSNTSDGGRVRKVFAMPSSGYRYIPQDTLLQIAEYFRDEMRGADTKAWFVTHSLSQIWMQFSAQAKDIVDTYKLPDTMIPGILLETSDTGDCALKVIPTWKRASGRTYVRAGEFKREHKGLFNMEDVKREIKETVFAVYTKLPQRLCDLLMIDIPNAEMFLETLFEDSKIHSILGKRRTKDLLEALQGEISPAASYTAYDIAMRMMDLPAIFEEDKWISEQMESFVYKIPFMDFNKMLKKSATPIVLTA